MNNHQERRALSGLITILMLTLLYSSAAFGAQPSEQDLEAFQHYLGWGGRLLEEQRYPEAIEALELAREIIDHPRITLSIAGAYRDWGRCGQARREYDELAEVEELDNESRNRLERGIGRLQDCSERARLVVQCAPPDGELIINGQSHSCPFDDDMEVGEQEVILQAPGYEDERRLVEVVGEEVNRISLVLRAAEDEPKQEAVVVAPQVEEKPKIPPVVLWTRIAGYSALGIGAGLVAGGVITDMGAGGRAQEIANAQGEHNYARIQELEQAASGARLQSIFFYSGGALFLATGIVLAAVDVAPTPDAADFVVQISPVGLWAKMRW